MRRGAHQRTNMRQTLAAIAFVALIVRVLAPAGYMLAPDAGGRFLTVQLCSGHGVATESVIDLTTGAVIDADAGRTDKAPSNSSGDDAPCVFAAAATLAAPEAAAAIMVAARVVFEEPPVAHHVSPGRGLAAPPPWSTGPPAIA